MNEERIYDEIKLTDYYGELCGLYKRADKIDPEYDYIYMISIDSEILNPDIEKFSAVINELCKKYDVDGSIEGLYFEPEFGLVFDNLEIHFDKDDEETAIEFAEEFLRSIKD